MADWRGIEEWTILFPKQFFLRPKAGRASGRLEPSSCELTIKTKKKMSSQNGCLGSRRSVGEPKKKKPRRLGVALWCRNQSSKPGAVQNRVQGTRMVSPLMRREYEPVAPALVTQPLGSREHFFLNARGKML